MCLIPSEYNCSCTSGWLSFNHSSHLLAVPPNSQYWRSVNHYTARLFSRSNQNAQDRSLFHTSEGNVQTGDKKQSALKKKKSP